MSGPYTVISEYFKTDTEISVMEISIRQSLRSAQYRARKSLKTAMLRPNYVPEVARVEDAQEKVISVYEWDSRLGRAVLVARS